MFSKFSSTHATDLLRLIVFTLQSFSLCSFGSFTCCSCTYYCVSLDLLAYMVILQSANNLFLIPNQDAESLQCDQVALLPLLPLFILIGFGALGVYQCSGIIPQCIRDRSLFKAIKFKCFESFDKLKNNLNPPQKQLQQGTQFGIFNMNKRKKETL